MFDNIDPKRFLMSMVALIICITIHEFAHAFSAYRAGDETPRKQGRISLNPIDHLDPIGTVMMVLSSLSGFGFGWGKAVMVNPMNFRSPRWDNLRVSLWGPLSNIITAAVIGIIFFRFIMPTDMAQQALQTSTVFSNLELLLSNIAWISLILAMFNLLPIGPLDGAKVVSSLLPVDKARAFDMFMIRYGMMLFLGVIIFMRDVMHVVIGVPAALMWTLFTGM